MNEEKIPEEVLNIKLNKKCPRGRPRWEHKDKRDTMQKKEII
jgi:hypothetical protein